MKLLLTSGGITNKSIAKALFDLVGKKPEDTSLVFIPTAAKTLPKKIYALDDQSVLKIVDGRVEIVTEGQYLEFN